MAAQDLWDELLQLASSAAPENCEGKDNRDLSNSPRRAYIIEGAPASGKTVRAPRTGQAEGFTLACSGVVGERRLVLDLTFL